MYNIARLLSDKTPRVGATKFVAVDGRGGSGKSTLAESLADSFHASIVHTDDFASWDNPMNWHSLVIENVFAPVANGARHLSYTRSSWYEGHHPEPVNELTVTPVMILEGVGSFRREFRAYLSLGIFVDTPREVSAERGIHRDRKKTEKSDEDLKQRWCDWLDEEDRYFARDKPAEHADVVVDGTEPFETQICLESR